MPSRRRFLEIAGAAGLALGLPRAFAADTWRTEFHAALAADPWLRAVRSVEAPVFGASATVAGKWPRGLAGTLYRNGPARHEVGDFRYRHWFDGDGMLQAWRLSAAGVQHQGRLVETTKPVAETRAGRALYPTFASQPPDPRPVTGPDVINVANISVLPHHGRLYALWEAGSPWEVDPDDLTTRGLHTFSAETAGVPFSAHPRVEPDGTLLVISLCIGLSLHALSELLVPRLEGSGGWIIGPAVIAVGRIGSGVALAGLLVDGSPLLFFGRDYQTLIISVFFGALGLFLFMTREHLLEARACSGPRCSARAVRSERSATNSNG